MGRFRALHDLCRQDHDDEGVNRRRAGRIMIESIRNSAGEVFDLSSTGARFRTRRKWIVGETQAIHFEFETGEEPIRLDARCVWVRQVSMMRRMVGVEFSGVTPTQQRQLAQLATRSAKRAWGQRRQSNDVNWKRLDHPSPDQSGNPLGSEGQRGAA